MQQLLLFAPSALRLHAIISKLISELEINTMHEASRTRKQLECRAGSERGEWADKASIVAQRRAQLAHRHRHDGVAPCVLARAKPSEVEPARARDSAASAAIAEGDAVAPSAAYQPAAE